MMPAQVFDPALGYNEMPLGWLMGRRAKIRAALKKKISKRAKLFSAAPYDDSDYKKAAAAADAATAEAKDQPEDHAHASKLHDRAAQLTYSIRQKAYHLNMRRRHDRRASELESNQLFLASPGVLPPSKFQQAGHLTPPKNPPTLVEKAGAATNKANDSGSWQDHRAAAIAHSAAAKFLGTGPKAESHTRWATSHSNKASFIMRQNNFSSNDSDKRANAIAISKQAYAASQQANAAPSKRAHQDAARLHTVAAHAHMVAAMHGDSAWHNLNAGRHDDRAEAHEIEASMAKPGAVRAGEFAAGDREDYRKIKYEHWRNNAENASAIAHAKNAGHGHASEVHAIAARWSLNKEQEKYHRSRQAEHLKAKAQLDELEFAAKPYSSVPLGKPGSLSKEQQALVTRAHAQDRGAGQALHHRFERMNEGTAKLRNKSLATQTRRIAETQAGVWLGRFASGDGREPNKQFGPRTGTILVTSQQFPKGTKVYLHHSNSSGRSRWCSLHEDGSQGCFVPHSEVRERGNSAARRFASDGQWPSFHDKHEAARARHLSIKACDYGKQAKSGLLSHVEARRAHDQAAVAHGALSDELTGDAQQHHRQMAELHLKHSEWHGSQTGAHKPVIHENGFAATRPDEPLHLSRKADHLSVVALDSGSYSDHMRAHFAHKHAAAAHRAGSPTAERHLKEARNHRYASRGEAPSEGFSAVELAVAEPGDYCSFCKAPHGLIICGTPGGPRLKCSECGMSPQTHEPPPLSVILPSQMFVSDNDSDYKIASAGADQATRRATDITSHKLAHRAHAKAAMLCSAAGDRETAKHHLEIASAHEKYFGSMGPVSKASLAPIKVAKPLDTSSSTRTASKKAFAAKAPLVAYDKAASYLRHAQHYAKLLGPNDPMVRKLYALHSEAAQHRAGSPGALAEEAK
jgi:hypothetical protein